MLPQAVTEALIIIIIITISIIHIHCAIIIIIAVVLDVTVSSNRAVDVPLCQLFGGFGCCRGRWSLVVRLWLRQRLLLKCVADASLLRF